jgi:hypothetical protein
MGKSRLLDAMTTLGQLVSNSLNDAGFSVSNQVILGEPPEPQLSEILGLNKTVVAVREYTGPRDVTRYLPDDTVITVRAPDIDVVVGAINNVLTFAGNVIPGLTFHVLIEQPYNDATYTTSVGDNVASVCAGIANAVNALGLTGVSASITSDTVTIAGVDQVQCNVSTAAVLLAREVGRRAQTLLVSCFSNNPDVRFTMHEAVSSRVGTAANVFVPLSDDTPMRLSYATGASDDKLKDSAQQRASRFTAHLAFDVEYSVLEYLGAATIGAIDNQITINSDAEIDIYAGGPFNPTPNGPPPPPADPQANFPPWNNWVTVPAATLIGRETTSAFFTTSELGGIASNWPTLVALIKGGGTGYFEDQVNAVATAWKAANPTGKLLFYVGFHGQRTDSYRYWTYPGAQPQWIGGKGDNRHDPAFRAWWSSAIAWMLTQYPQFDGVFIDSLGKYNADSYDLISQLRSKITVLIPGGKLLLGNTYPGPLPSEGSTYFDGTLDGSFSESIIGRQDEPDQIKATIDAIYAMSAAGRITILRTWPGFANVQNNVPSPYGTALADARANIDLGLGCYLVSANKYSYFAYGWGYGDVGGELTLVTDQYGNLPTSPTQYMNDSTWYAEMFKRLGPPTGPPTHPNGLDGLPSPYLYARSFEYAIVNVNLTAGGGPSASITWS